MPHRKPRRTVHALAALFAASLLAPAISTAEAAVHALVIGINDYASAGKLRGAVNDARDVSQALRDSGAKTVTVMVDREASRARVFKAWRALVANSEPGDLLIFHFAGHGINEVDTNGDEKDGQDEAYLFAEFDEITRPEERLIDDELDSWLAEAGNAGRKVLFIADACHSGSPTRSIFGEALPTRLYIPRTEPERPRPLTEVPVEASRDFVFSVGATFDSRTVPEIMIEDAARGALSYAVARAIEGNADLNGDGTILANEFEAYVQETVRVLAESKQTPQFSMPDEGQPIIERAIAVVADEDTEKPASIGIHIRPGADAAFRSAIAAIDDVALVDNESDAHLVFDPVTGALANTVRDQIAEGLDLNGLKTAIEADKALKKLHRLAVRAPLPIAFSPDDKVHPEGTLIGFTVPGVGGKFLTVFDLTAKGTVNFLWPTRPRDDDPIKEGENFSLEAQVTPPFGADNLVVLRTDTPPEKLRSELARLDGGSDPAALLRHIEDAIAGEPYKLGIQAFFTRRK